MVSIKSGNNLRLPLTARKHCRGNCFLLSLVLHHCHGTAVTQWWNILAQLKHPYVICSNVFFVSSTAHRNFFTQRSSSSSAWFLGYWLGRVNISWFGIPIFNQISLCTISLTWFDQSDARGLQPAVHGQGLRRVLLTAHALPLWCSVH